VTVKNQGTDAAGPFNVTMTGEGTVRFTDGLAAGASEMRAIPSPDCYSPHHAVADSGNEVIESDETNNTKDIMVIC
jgi:subtilase family serine protease